MCRYWSIVSVIINFGLVYVCSLPYPRTDDSYMQLLSALSNAKETPDSYMGSLYGQLYDDYDSDITYQDYIDELMREELINRQATGEALGNYYDLTEDEDEDFRGPIDLEVEENWPTEELKLGQVTGVAVDGEGFPHIFHRGSRVWDQNNALFDENNKFTAAEEGAIKEPTLLKLSFDDGSIVNQWGENRFYLPHGLTIDNDGNTWVTDVALHQVFKFEPGKDEPSLTLGEEFQPATDNSDKERFCKPTDVVVSSNGEIFVADGYCNSRIVKFSEDGNYIGQLGDDVFVIPHSIALAEDLNLICVADREDMRILCYNAGLENGDMFGGQYVRKYHDPEMGRIYGIEYNPATGLLHVVNGPTGKERAFGFTIDLYQDAFDTEVVDEWSPNNMGFDQPHDVAVSPDGNSVYVGEIGPNRVFKFENVAGNDVIAEIPVDAEEIEEEDQNSEEEIDNIKEQEVENKGSDQLEDELENEEEELKSQEDVEEIDNGEDLEEKELEEIDEEEEQEKSGKEI